MAKMLPLLRYIAKLGKKETRKQRLIRQRKEGKFETTLEKKVRWSLELNRVRFEQERYFPGVGMVDFFLPSYCLVVEADGIQWHSTKKAVEHDRWRDKRLRARGLRVLRLPEKLIRSCSYDELANYILFIAKGER